MDWTQLEETLESFKRGEMVVFVHEDALSTEGYLAVAAEKTTAASLERMASYSMSYLGLALTPEQMEARGVPLSRVASSATPLSAVTEPPEPTPGDGAARSAAEQAAALRAFADPALPPGAEKIPAWLVPERALPGGVLVSATPADAAVDLARLAGLQAMAVVCRISSNSSQATTSMEAFAGRHGFRVLSIAELITYRRRCAPARLVALPTPVRLPTRFGQFSAQVYEDPLDGLQHMAIYVGDLSDERPALTRLHSECLTGDVFGSLRCDCGPQLERALELIAAAGHGILLYLRQEGRGLGLYNKLRAYALQERGLDTVEANEQLGFPADLRDYGAASQILADLGIKKIRLLTNNPRKIEGLENGGFEIVERVPLVVSASEENRFYLRTKQAKLGHMLLEDEVSGG